MTDLVQFSHDVFTSFSSLSLMWKLTVGGAVCYIGAKTVLVPTLIALVRLTKPIRMWMSGLRKPDQFEPGKIYLHMFARKVSPQVPNLSPYAIKVETWFRLQNIKYEVVETFKFSKATRQIPYVIYDDEEITDSNFIIDFFSQEREVDYTEGLSDEEQGVSRAFTAMVDEQTSMTYLLHRYVYNFATFKDKSLRIQAFQPLKFLIERMMPKSFKVRADAQGMGRKTEAEVNRIAFSTLNAISQYLGDKQFMMGDEITRVDCTIFGHLCQVVYVDFPYPHMPFIKTYCKNLLPYLDRIKEKLWPDWDDLVVKS